MRLENILCKTKLVQDEEIMSIEQAVIKEYDSQNYCEMIACLRKHQLAIKFVLWKILL